MSAEVRSIALDQPLDLPELTYLVEQDEVTVGCREIDSYWVLPIDGAELLRRLGTGMSPESAAQWYSSEYGETVDIVEFLETLTEMGLLALHGDTELAPVRWQRLGRALFSPVGWAVFAIVLVAALVAMARHPDLLPIYQHLFFTRYLTVISVTVFLGQFPLLLLHEACHALAGRRLGLPSRLRISNRLYFLVFETSLDGLVAVPRRKRYLPILAGVCCDMLVVAVLTLVAAALRQPAGGQPLIGGICLTLAFTTVLRIVWQLYFYLRTDLYYLVITVFGCVDLHDTARGMIVNRINRLVGRRALVDESAWHPTDRAVARWYSWLVVVGYLFSLGTLVVAALPAIVRMIGIVLTRLSAGAGWADIADTAVLLALTLGQFVVVFVVARRRRRSAN